MSKVVMIADDLTGANANCSLMKKIGLQAASILTLDQELPKDMSVLAYTTDSRAMLKKDAYHAVAEAMDKFMDEDVRLYSKRVDSTLRGNLGVELNAVFDKLGEDFIGIAAPFYPATGRIVVNGIMLVNGSLLLNTDAGRDTKAPVKSSRVEELFKKDFKGKVRSIFLEDIEKGKENIASLLKSGKKEGVKLFLFDGVTDYHLNQIATGAILSGEDFFSIDPGPFTMEIARQFQERSEQLDKILMVVGSVTDITIEQIRETIIEYPVNILEVDPNKLVRHDLYKEEIGRASKEAFKLLKKEDNLLITTTPFHNPKDRLNLSAIAQESGMNIDDLSLMLSYGLGRIAKNVLMEDLSFAGVYLSGGDITVAMADELGSTGIEILEEVVPLAAYGKMIGGLKPGLHIISKGGMVGDKNTMKDCIEKLKFN